MVERKHPLVELSTSAPHYPVENYSVCLLELSQYMGAIMNRVSLRDGNASTLTLMDRDYLSLAANGDAYLVALNGSLSMR